MCMLCAHIHACVCKLCVPSPGTTHVPTDHTTNNRCVERGVVRGFVHTVAAHLGLDLCEGLHTPFRGVQVVWGHPLSRFLGACRGHRERESLLCDCLCCSHLTMQDRAHVTSTTRWRNVRNAQQCFTCHGALGERRAAYIRGCGRQGGRK